MDIDDKVQGETKNAASADSATADIASADTAYADTAAAAEPPRKPLRGGRYAGGEMVQ